MRLSIFGLCCFRSNVHDVHVLPGEDGISRALRARRAVHIDMDGADDAGPTRLGGWRNG
jgi:hypothetical protein